MTPYVRLANACLGDTFEYVPLFGFTPEAAIWTVTDVWKGVVRVTLTYMGVYMAAYDGLLDAATGTVAWRPV